MSIILKNNKYVETMQGMCYSDRILSTKLHAEMFEIEHHGIFCRPLSFFVAFSQIFSSIYFVYFIYIRNNFKEHKRLFYKTYHIFLKKILILNILDYSKDIWFDPIHGFSVAFVSSRVC